MVTLNNVCKQYNKNVSALNHINLDIKKGEFIVVKGPSGSGKTTLLLTIGGMLQPTSGKVIFNEKNIYTLSERDSVRFRAVNIGFVFQMFHLLPYLNILENVMLQADIVTNQINKAEAKAKEILHTFHLSDRASHKPAELSAGESQRAAIARAMLNKPDIILADEPTGNLDPENAADVVEYLSSFHKKGGTVIVATHGETADSYADRFVYLKNGELRTGSDRFAQPVVE